MSDYPYDKASGKARQEARQANASRVAEAAAILRMKRAGDRAVEETRQQLLREASAAAASSSNTHQQATSSSMPHTTPRGPGEKEARWLREMFQAVWPDMKGITGATKVASYTGSLTLSLALGAFVYYASTRYQAAKDPPPAPSSSGQPEAKS